MEEYSLKQLKAENGDEVETIDNEVVEQPKEELQDEYIEVDENLKPVEDEPEDDEEVADGETEIESWMQSDEATPDESGFTPNHEAAKRRKQAKALKATVAEKDSELETLKKQIEQLQSGAATPQQPQTEALPERPTREQFDYDDDAYDKAVDEWNDKKIEARFNSFSQSSNQKADQERQQQEQLNAKAAQDKVVDSHYERASKLVEEGKIDADKYQQADRNFRQAMNVAFPDKGDAITEQLISKIGEGSEKVMYSLGVNNAKLAELQSRILSDKSGLSAAMYLGELKSQLSTPTKRRSQAKKPAKQVNGDVQASDSHSKLRKKYDKMTSVQDRVSFKRKARADGVDVSNW